MTATHQPGSPGNREIISTRLFGAPRELVFRAFSDPRILAQWWGPKGFTNTFHAFNFQPGGAWRFVMHGPDGTDYQMVNDFVEVIHPERISFQHRQPAHDFLMTITFADEAGKTRLTWLMQFESAEAAGAVRSHVTEVNEQNFDRLEAQLATMAPNAIDQYIAGFPGNVQEILQRIRMTIRNAAPDAEEAIKYDMPTFTLNGNLVHFAAFKKHVGFYSVPSGIQELADELSAYEGGKGSVKFPFDKPIPLDLVSKIVKARVKENLQRAEADEQKR